MKRFVLTLSLAWLATPALAILPQQEPPAAVRSYARALATHADVGLYVSPALPAHERALLETTLGAGGAPLVLPTHALSWTVSKREYRVVAPGRNAPVLVTLERRGTGPWQVTSARAAR
ncbi:hypothetical protein [Deinococcus pimensis]|uniref:hypothetical protein n=1 Tax=Deinococcus pimensis TaxID=309888 RepID=UPI000488C790|nr:hypothetical protein [Deinococcus pimensis]